MLSFQRLDVYKRGIEFLALAYDIVGDLPKGHAERADQLVRAAEAILRKVVAPGRYEEGIAFSKPSFAILTKMI